MFSGNSNPETLQEVSEWVFWITNVVMPILDTENGDFRQLPFPGSIIDQPYASFEICKLIQLNYRIHLNNRMKKLKK